MYWLKRCRCSSLLVFRYMQYVSCIVICWINFWLVYRPGSVPQLGSIVIGGRLGPRAAALALLKRAACWGRAKYRLLFRAADLVGPASLLARLVGAFSPDKIMTCRTRCQITAPHNSIVTINTVTLILQYSGMRIISYIFGGAFIIVRITTCDLSFIVAGWWALTFI